MGDMLTLIEKAEKDFDEKEALRLSKKLKENKFDMNDLLSQMQQIKKMGSVKDLIKMLPGAGKIDENAIDESGLYKTEAIILSMTKKEREKPAIINPSRKKRIAAGSGTTVTDVNRLLKQYEQMRDMFKKMSGKKGKMGRFNPSMFGM
jgi:signal recognition particle subunit SRP54